MTTSERDIAIIEGIKQIVNANPATMTIIKLKDELKKIGIKGVGGKQIIRCIQASGLENHFNIATTKNSMVKDEMHTKSGTNSKTQTKYKRPKGSDAIYKDLLQCDWANDVNKSFGIYGIAIDDVYVYVGQSMNLLRRMADHQYWIDNYDNDENPNKQLYLLLREALNRDRKVSFVIIAMFNTNINFNSKKASLDMYESQIIQAKLPIANRAIPDPYGNITHLQSLYVNENNIDEFFAPEFVERRDLLDVDLRRTYAHIFNPYYDEKLKNRLYMHKYDILKSHSDAQLDTPLDI